jgi:nitrate reductase (cytochrome), electron transfer subunit
MKTRLAIAASVVLLAQAAVTAFPAGAAPGGELVNGLRGTAPLDREPAAPAMQKPVNDDVRRGRAFAMQPPVIPHQIENYQVDRNFNKCMTCHGRERTQESQAPMVSVTHYMDRQGEFRAEISPRRYFCVQCHVPQLEVKPPVENRFLDVEKAAVQKRTQGARK